MALSFSAKFRTQGWPLALALVVPTIYPSSDVMWIPALVLCLVQQPKLALRSADYLLFAFIGGVFVQTLLGLGFHLETGQQWSPAPLSYILLPFCVYLGRSLSSATIRWLIGFFCIEAAVCGIQMILRQPYVFAGQREAILNAGTTEWGSTDLLYFNRMYGLSTNSSVAAQKFLLGLMLLFDNRSVQSRKLIPITLLGVGLYATFNRTALLTAAVFLGLKVVGIVAQVPLKRRLQIVTLAGLLLTVTILNWSSIENQFLRGNMDSSLVTDAGRGSLWSVAFEWIADHPLAGNLSQRFLVFEYGEWFHLHNTWLQLVADHGLVGWLLILHTVALARRVNFVFFAAIVLYSFVQFGLFGKISLINIIFYYLMNQRAGYCDTPVPQGGTSSLVSRDVAPCHS